MAKEEEIRRLRAMGLSTATIAQTLGISEDEVTRVLVEAYKDDPLQQLLDELDAIRMQYDDIIMAKELDPKLAEIKLEALKQKQSVLDRKRAILEKKLGLPTPSKPSAPEIIEVGKGCEISGNSIKISDFSLWKDNVMKLWSELEKTLLKPSEKILVIMDALGITEAIRSGVNLSNEFENRLAEVLGVKVQWVWWARKTLKNEPEKAEKIIAKAKRRGFKITDF